MRSCAVAQPTNDLAAALYGKHRPRLSVLADLPTGVLPLTKQEKSSLQLECPVKWEQAACGLSVELRQGFSHSVRVHIRSACSQPTLIQ